MKPRDILIASTIGLSSAISPSLTYSAVKVPPSVAGKVGGVLKGAGRTIFGADKTTRIAHGIYASMSIAQLSALDERGMDDMAYRYYLSERTKAEDSDKLLDPERDKDANRVQQITRTIIATIRQNPEYVDRYNQIKTDISSGTGWKIMTIDNPTLNAYCLPGGRMVVYSGLARLLSDDELAVVISHEIMHAMKGHSFQTAKESLMKKAAIFAGAAVAGAKSLPVSMGILAEVFTTSTVYSRGHEKEADISGLHIAGDAGYNPRAAITLWQKMEKNQKNGQPPEILSSHPSHESRERYLREEIEKMGK
ncbi:M48 family metallopeptidase [Candidatus Gracilibacteria bacterium]|nr:M48 family metallopeptidase [Candidatus Gracilibacteria bacterium]